MNVDIQKNLDYYKSESSIVCDCSGCKNFCMQIKEKQPKIYKYFDELNFTEK